MPSFNHVLVLAVLALSVSVQSAPVGPETIHGIAPTETFPLPGTQITESGAAASPDEVEDADADDEDVDPLVLERRATKTLATAPKAKITKAPKSKTTKAAAPKPKTTKAKTTKVKTTAKATKATKPVKTTKAATTAKPAQTPKVTKTKTSKTTKSTGTATPSACPVKKPVTKPRSFTTRAFDYVAHLFERDDQEFIGWHGTNSQTAALWASKGFIEKPTKITGKLDFLGIGEKVTIGTSGANAEIGPGLYVTDDKFIGVTFALDNAKVNKGTTPSLCAIFARSSANWRGAIRKAFIETALVGRSDAKENQRIEHIKQAVPGVTPQTVVKFALFNRDEKSGQMVLPELIGNQFSAKCFNVDPETEKVAASDVAASEVGTHSFPDFNYNGDTLREEWNITPENAGTCS